MFNLKKTPEIKSSLDEALEIAVQKLKDTDPSTKDYAVIAQNVKTLTEANTADKAAHKPNVVSADTLAMIFGNLTGLILVLGYEHGHAITSKAFGQIGRIKI